MKSYVVFVSVLVFAAAGEVREKRGIYSGLHSAPLTFSAPAISSYSYAPSISYSSAPLSYSFAPVSYSAAPVIRYAPAPAPIRYSASISYTAPVVAAPTTKLISEKKVVNVQKLVTVPQVVNVQKLVSVPQVVTVNRVVSVPAAAPSYASGWW